MQQPAVDPFHPLLRVIDRYRRDVHQLEPPPSAESVDGAVGFLGQPIPPTLLAFLNRWNGARLFRGALRIRSVAELAPASEGAPSVIVFADGPGDHDRWAFAPDGQGGAVFGRWGGEAFEPLHEHFDRWLMATVRVLDENIRDPGAQLEARLDADPECGFLLLSTADRALEAGDPDTAGGLLRRATAADPGLVAAWVRLGDAMLGQDRQSARFAYLKALRALRLPAPYPTVHAPEPELIHTLAHLFPPGDAGWERELEHLLAEGVRDVSSFAELALAEAGAVALARVRLDRDARGEAREALAGFLGRVPGFVVRGPCPEATLLLVEIETELGHHDEAEKRLRSFRIAPPPLQARANLALGRIAVLRQEPWAEEILREALAGLTDPNHRAEALLLLGERHLLLERYAEAEDVFQQAGRLARQLSSDPLAARAALGLGDVLRLRGDGPSAETRYREARALAGENRELLGRVLLRRGDLHRMTGVLEAAAEDYARAAKIYRELELPLREAWARVRLARLGVTEAAVEATELFKASDLAAGVAAADAVTGDPARNLDWHLERATEHARERANAQRVRPPLTRADADRPERRLGAHRMAIAACSVAVAETLGAELESLAKTLDLASPRLTDPKLARYVAAADLLAGHRSYEASEAMLRQVMEIRPGGLAGRALIGALSRSSNAALVDGLLRAIESGGDPNGVAAAAEVLGWRREALAVPALCRMVERERRAAVRRAAVVALGRIGDAEAIPAVLSALDVPELAEEAAVSLLLLGEWQGVDHHAQALAAQQPNLTRSPGEIVGRYGGPSYLLLLLRTAELEGPAGLGALQGLGYLGDPRAVPRLIDATGARDQTRAYVASGALEILTGHPESVDESLLRNRWTEWWAQNASSFTPGVRYRLGRRMDAGLLIERLSHDDAMVRRATYDELVISTGVRLPFDPEGPYRVQVAHQAAWRRWWREHAEEYPAGRWWFGGGEIG